jgi:enoyl-CoA hydratase/carnithine racemase
MDAPVEVTELVPDGPVAHGHGSPGPVVRIGWTRTLPVLPQGMADAYDVLLTGPGRAPAPWVSEPDPEEAALTLRERIADAPNAALALVQVLRMGPRLTPNERLVAESLAYSTLQAGSTFRHWLATTRRPPHRPAHGSPVRLAREGDLLRVTLDRPKARNAVDAATRDALCEALELALADASLTRVVLCGEGPDFSAGGDLSEFGASTDPSLAHRVRLTRSPADLLRRLSARTETVARLHGACVGAGIELPAFANHIVAAPDTVIRLPELELGLIPGAGGTASLPPRIGRHRTAWLALTGARLDAGRALEWGLVDTVAR